MDCCDPNVYDNQFDDAHAAQKLREFREHGPKGWTARLIDELSAVASMA